MKRTGSTFSPSDSARFPDAMESVERKKLGHGHVWLPAFATAVQIASQRVLIADRYLFEDGDDAVQRLLAWLPDSIQASDIRIVASDSGRSPPAPALHAKFSDRQDAINRIRGGVPPLAQIQLKLNMDPDRAPYLHDRFAIIDDDLWHFGATVGGLHAGVNAASHGWPIGPTDALKFFNRLWGVSGTPPGHSGRRRR